LYCDHRASALYGVLRCLPALPQLRSNLRAILVEHRERAQRAHRDEIQQHEREADEQRQRRLFTEFEWYADPPPERLKNPESRWVQLAIDYHHELSKIADPTTLVMIDEADRLKMNTLEQIRDIFDQGGIGVVFMGMPGIEKRLSRYPQLYARVGFVPAFRPLSAAPVRELLHQKWRPSGVVLPAEGVTDEEALAAIIRVTGGQLPIAPPTPHANRPSHRDQCAPNGHK
jgi:hypothetical protein